MDEAIAALDMRAMRSVVIASAGDSTGDYADEFYETALKELFAEHWPDRPARLLRWQKTPDAYPSDFTIWQTAESPATPGTPGGTVPNTLIGYDSFARTGPLVGSALDTGAGAWTGTTGVLSTDGDRLVTTGASSAIVAAPLAARSGADFAASCTMRIASNNASNKQTKFYGVRKDASNDLEIALAGSTSVAVTVVKRIAGTATVLGTLPANTIPSGQPAADYVFALSLSGTTLTATVNGQSMSFELTGGDLAAVEAMTTVGFNSPADPTWQAETLEVRGAVTTAPSDPTPAVPSPLPWATVYNGMIAGSTIASQLARIDAMYPERPDVLVVNHGQNYGADTGAAFLAAVDGFVSAMHAKYDDQIPVVVCSQNPRFTGDANEVGQRARMAALRAHARERDWVYVPTFEAFAARADGGKSLVNAGDNVHPLPVSGAADRGARRQADVLKRELLALSGRP
ncbi:SGNH/GDSL hydrolase family protein [Nocardioides sp. zg-DK7169]|uniref:SGNH/GDSL hydrolase family protein n=1 Tax=Nocardioides sp. zg-DK7169 TaxID=2736600 RepID=UPI0015558458|nr:SGNH/GDSL hydrolase family protein [Nocardioides sp. zg-DK7169]NPC97255.1 SGNH/GDSL hydrolase family protein [Nocardioides sp. zg-DK7169]